MSRFQAALIFVSKIPKLAQVFMSKSGSSIDEHVGQIFIDIHTISVNDNGKRIRKVQINKPWGMVKSFIL